MLFRIFGVVRVGHWDRDIHSRDWIWRTDSDENITFDRTLGFHDFMIGLYDIILFRGLELFMGLAPRHTAFDSFVIKRVLRVEIRSILYIAWFIHTIPHPWTEALVSVCPHHHIIPSINIIHNVSGSRRIQCPCQPHVL